MTGAPSAGFSRRLTGPSTIGDTGLRWVPDPGDGKIVREDPLGPAGASIMVVSTSLPLALLVIAAIVVIIVVVIKFFWLLLLVGGLLVVSYLFYTGTLHF